MNMIQERPVVAVGATFLLGLVIGLLWGWVIAPVEWTFENPNALAGAICALAESDSANAQTYENMVRAYNNGLGCTSSDITAPDPSSPITPEEDEMEDGGSNSLSFGLILLLFLLVVAAVLVWRRRSTLMGETAVDTPRYEDVPDMAPVVGGNDNIEAIPIARFRTTYTIGHDTYDDSFSIENSSADFLGECGVSIAESIGADSPKNVTAFEVWLFDKNDIRTITKVVMSDHAFFDDALKAKLAPKGEPVLARENETIVLETATLIINAEITELVYGTGVLPPQSFFERFAIELSAWSKEGDYDEPDLQGRADELMNF